MLESLFDNVACLKACHFIKKRLQHRRFPVNIAKFLKRSFFIENLQRLLLKDYTSPDGLWRYWKETPTQVVSCKIYKIFQNSFFYRTGGGCFWLCVQLLQAFLLFFYKQPFFSIQLQSCLTFSWIELQILLWCCYKHKASSYWHSFYIKYICALGLVVSYLCDRSIFHFHFHSYCN